MKYTKSDIKKLGICPDYTDERLDELAAGRESLSERELAELDIPINDRLWLLGRLCADEHNTMARRIAMDVLSLWKRPVPDVTMRYLETGESDIKAAARAAADAAGGAARAAAGDAWAAWAAAMAARAAADAAGDTADAAGDTADAAGNAAGNAAGDTARAAADAAGDTWAAWASGAAVMLKAKKKYLDWMVEFCESRKAGF
jgi:hypothetical protein